MKKLVNTIPVAMLKKRWIRKPIKNAASASLTNLVRFNKLLYWLFAIMALTLVDVSGRKLAEAAGPGGRPTLAAAWLEGGKLAAVSSRALSNPLGHHVAYRRGEQRELTGRMGGADRGEHRGQLQAKQDERETSYDALF